MSLIAKFNGNMNVIGTKLRECRLEKGFSYEMLVTKLDLMGINIHRQSLYDIEHNKRTVKDYELFGIITALDLDINIFLNEFNTQLKKSFK